MINRIFFLKKERGISLVELIVAMAIMGIVVTIVINLYIGSSRFVSAEQLRIDVSENAARVLSGMDEVLREGREVLTSVDYNSVTYTSGETMVVLTTPSPLADGSLSPSEADTVVLYLDSTDPDNLSINRIIAAVGIGSTRATGVSNVVRGVKDLYFRYTTDTVTETTVVTATVTTEKTVNTRPFTTAMILNATLRNHP